MHLLLLSWYKVWSLVNEVYTSFMLPHLSVYCEAILLRINDCG